MILFFSLVLALIVAPGVAMADPISALTTLIAGALGGSALAVTIASFATRLIFGAIVSLVGQLFAEKPKGIKPQGIQTEQTTTGDTTPQKFIVGRYAAEGHAVAPAYSRSNDNHILTYILEVSNIPIKGLTGRVIIDGQYTDLTPGEDDASRLDFSTLGVNDLGNPRGWLWFFDGKQTTAFNQLVNFYGEHPDRPWTNNHILQGTAYAVLEFALDREIYTGLPSVRFEAEGIALYDPRKDSSVGGSGAHRWADPDTWEFSENPQVINYNILRGITLPTGDVYGGQVAAEDLPLDNWFAAMNECDLLIGDRPQYRAGFEVNTGVMEPFEVLEEMNRSSFAQISEFGGVFRVRVGAPSTPVMSLTDDDFMITEPASYEPFPGLANTYNAITGTYVEPVDVWEGRSADAVLNEEWEAEDGGRRLTIDVGLPAVSDKSQAQQLLNAYVKDQRRFRVHRMALPPSYALIEPLDCISWTSETNGYTSKVFEVVTVEDRPDTLNQFVTVREREAGDVAWTAAQDVSAPPPTNVLTPPASNIPSLSVSAFSIKDGDDVARRPGIALAWPSDEALSAETLKYEIRVKETGAAVTSAVVSAREGATSTMDGILASVTYQVRARYISGLPVAWTSWLEVTTSNILLGEADLSESIVDRIETAFDRHNQALDTLTSGTVFQLLNEVRIEDAILAVQNVNNAALSLIDMERSEEAFAQITTEKDTRVSADEALASQIITVIANVDENASAIVTEQTARADADSALAANIVSLAAAVDDNAAAIVTEQSVRANGDAAVANSVAGLSATVTANQSTTNAAILAEQTARADADTALASEATALGVRLSGAELAVRSGNLIPNGRLETGDFTSWSGVSGTFTVVAKGGSAPRNAAPTPYMVQVATVPSGTPAQSATLVENVPVAPDDTFNLSFDATTVSSVLRNDVTIAFDFFDASGDPASTVLRIAEVRATSWARYTQRPKDAGGDDLYDYTFKGEWAQPADYAAGDAVVHEGRGYFCILDHTSTPGNVPPSVAQWELMPRVLFPVVAPSGAVTAAVRLEQTYDEGLANILMTNIRMDRVTMSVQDVAAQISKVDATKVDGDGAVAAIEQVISATYGDLEAMASATAFAEATADGIAGGFVWRINGENLLELVSVEDGVDTGPVSTYLIAADYVRITGTAQIQNAIITGAKIGNGEVDSLQIAGNSATFGTFAETVTTLVGDGTMDFVFVEYLSIPAGETADIYISVSLEHGYIAGAKDWGFELNRAFTPASPSFRQLRARVGMEAPNDYPTITYMETITNGTEFASDYQVTFQWRGEDNGIEMNRANMSLLGRIR